MDELRAEFSRLAKASSFISSGDQSRLSTLCVLLLAHSQKKAKALVQQAGQKPVLVSYSADPSALLLTDTATSSSTPSLTRKGRVLVDFLLQRVVYKFLDEERQSQLHMVLGMPVPLSKGKAAPNLFTAAAKLDPMIRSWDHPGIVLQHSVCDRAIHSALENLLRARQAAYYHPEHGMVSEEDAGYKALQDMWFSTPCAAHAAQNSIQWSLPSLCSPQVLQNLHVAIESLRNSFSLLREHLWTFLQRHVAFRGTPHDEDEARCLWAALGVDASMLPTFAEVHPVWEGDRLMIGSSLVENHNATALVSDVILYLFRWRKFTESRFTSLGVACRSLLASLVAGLPALVQLTRDDPHATDFHLQGFGKLDQQTRHACVVIALCTWPAESLMYELLDDDRLGRRSKELWEQCVEETKYLMGIGHEVWHTLAASIALSFLSLLFGKRQGKPPKKQGFFIPTESQKSLEKKGNTLKKTRNSSQAKKARNSKKARKGRTGWRPHHWLGPQERGGFGFTDLPWLHVLAHLPLDS